MKKYQILVNFFHDFCFLQIVGTSYFCRVRQCNRGVCGAYSPVTYLTACKAPDVLATADLTATNNAGAVTIDWSNAILGAWSTGGCTISKFTVQCCTGGAATLVGTTWTCPVGAANTVNTQVDITTNTQTSYLYTAGQLNTVMQTCLVLAYTEAGHSAAAGATVTVTPTAR